MNLTVQQKAGMWSISDKQAGGRAEGEAKYIASIIRHWEKRLGEDFSSLLDIPCGLGRHYPVLRKSGFHYTGMDAEVAFVREAARRYPRASFSVGHMEGIPRGPAQFDAIVNLFTSFGYGSDEMNQQVLGEFARVLRKGGLLLIDGYNGRRQLEWAAKERHGSWIFADWATDEDLRLVFNSIKGKRWLFDRQLLHRTATGYTELIRAPTSVALYSVGELTSMCRKAGLEVLERYKAHTMEPLKRDDQNMLLVARRK